MNVALIRRYEAILFENRPVCDDVKTYMDKYFELTFKDYDPEFNKEFNVIEAFKLIERRLKVMNNSYK